MFNENKICGKCAYHDPRAGICVLRKCQVTDSDYCSSYTNTPTVCATCQTYILGRAFLHETRNGYIEVCERCTRALPTCAGCINGAHCAFEEDPNPMPKVVMQTIRQGNAVMQTQVRNPERVKLFCEKCSCWDSEDKACNREFGCCGRHISILNP